MGLQMPGRALAASTSWAATSQPQRPLCRQRQALGTGKCPLENCPPPPRQLGFGSLKLTNQGNLRPPPGSGLSASQPSPCLWRLLTADP